MLKLHTVNIMQIIREPISKLNQIPIHENNDPLILVSKYCPDIFIDLKPEVLEHEKHAYLRKTIAVMLNKAQSNLPNGHRLRIWDAWRDPVRQKQKYDRYFDQLKSDHPNWPLNILVSHTNQMLFPVNAKTPPPHSTGSAVDLTIVDSNGTDLDMMSPFTNRYDEAVTSSTKISTLAKQNRQLLYNVMVKAGFTNYSFEWWHYSYGDSAWALRTGKKYAIYNRTQPNHWNS